MSLKGRESLDTNELSGRFYRSYKYNTQVIAASLGSLKENETSKFLKMSDLSYREKRKKKNIHNNKVWKFTGGYIYGQS